MNKMHYASIRHMDTSNGEGIGVALFVQGCNHCCKNCFNQETWDFNGGKEWTSELEELLLSFCSKSYISRLSILGGEPLHPKNIDTVIEIAKKFKARYPEKKLYIWTGYLYQEICNKEILKYADIIIDGKYIDELRDLRLALKGSSNQRVIDVRETEKTGNIVLFKE